MLDQGSNFSLRNAQRSDAKRISELLAQLGYETAADQVEGLLLKSDTANEAHYVAVQNETVIAVFSLIYFNYFPSAERFCRLTALVVDKSLRGTGIGSNIIKAIQSIAKENNCDVLEITTSFRRVKTHEFYEKCGFTKTSFKFILTLNN